MDAGMIVGTVLMGGIILFVLAMIIFANSPKGHQYLDNNNLKSTDSDLSTENSETNIEIDLSNLTNYLKNELVAPLADTWQCDVCGSENHNTETCIKCGYKAGSWKCKKCGFVVGEYEFYRPGEIYICPNCLYDLTEDKYVSQEEFDELFDYFNVK